MHQHRETFKSNHEFLLLTTIKNLKEKSYQEKGKLKEKYIEIGQLKELNTMKDETLTALKYDLENLKSQLENVCKQLTIKIKKNEEQTKDRFKEMNANQTQQSSKVDQLQEDSSNLQMFAKRISKLHFTLSDRLLRTKNHFHSTVFQDDYDKNEDVTKWNDMVKEVNEDDNKCNYLETLKSSMNQYKETIYSSTYKKRVQNFCFSTSQGTAGHCGFIKIGYLRNTHYICVKGYKDLHNFKKEIERNDEQRSCKIQNDPNVCSYYVGDCLHVVLYLRFHHNKIYLLDRSNESEKLDLPKGLVVKLDNMWNYIVQNSIVLYII